MYNYKPSSNRTHQEYLGYLKPGFRPFDPIKLAKKVERVVCDGNKRRYFRFGSTINYQTGIATGYTVGCCLRCIFCWSSETRDFLKKTSNFYTPQEVLERLTEIAQKKHLNQIRISDAEPTISKRHLLELLELIERSNFKRFILETNGIILGYDRNYVKSLSQFRKVHVRISIKAGTPTDFTLKTGALPETFELPFRAIRYLKKEGIRFWVAAMSSDPRFMTPFERVSLIGKLADIDPNLVLNLEEEMVVLFPQTIKRLKAIGWDMKNNKLSILQKVPMLKKFLQIRYLPISSIGRCKLSKSFTIKAIRELFHGI